MRVAVRIRSELVRNGRVKVFLDFPHATAGASKFDAPYVGFWDRPELHGTDLKSRGSDEAVIRHTIDATAYDCGVRYSHDAGISRMSDDLHRYEITAGRTDQLEVSCHFAPQVRGAVPSADQVARQSEKWWPRFWATGGAVDLSESRDPRWRELERRIVLSQYHLAVNDAGNDPAQESGLVNNGWYGKFHMEMYWWHSAHYALWDRWSLLDRSADVYARFTPHAKRSPPRAFAGRAGRR